MAQRTPFCCWLCGSGAFLDRPEKEILTRNFARLFFCFAEKTLHEGPLAHMPGNTPALRRVGVGGLLAVRGRGEVLVQIRTVRNYSCPILLKKKYSDAPARPLGNASILARATWRRTGVGIFLFGLSKKTAMAVGFTVCILHIWLARGIECFISSTLSQGSRSKR